jgi:hypothetical protein
MSSLLSRDYRFSFCGADLSIVRSAVKLGAVGELKAFRSDIEGERGLAAGWAEQESPEGGESGKSSADVDGPDGRQPEERLNDLPSRGAGEPCPTSAGRHAMPTLERIPSTK